MSTSTPHETPQHTPHDLTRQLAEFAADRTLHARFSATAITLAEQAITDSIGCILAGIDDPAALKLGDTFPDEPGGASQRSSSVRHRHALSARDAAAVNACAGHARELDDNVMPGAVHSSIVLTPALFALGEEICAPGSEVVRAFIVGQEVNTHIVELVDPAHNRLGWNVNSSIGVFGAAAACAALMKLDADRMVHALSLAFSMSSGTNLQFGSEAKPLHCGLAAGAGVWAAQLAAQGFRGHPRVFQGRYSFGALYADAHSQRPFVPTLFPDAALAIDQHPPVAKLYPCCGSAHLAIEALLTLRQQHAFAPEHVERVDVHMLEQMVDNLQHDRPQDEKQARFSLPYCAAVALVHGLPRLAHFTPEAVRRPAAAVAALMPRVHKHVRVPTEAVLARRLAFIGDCLVRVTLKDGQVLETITEHPKGCRENPLTGAERHAKFIDCAAPALGEARAASLEQALLGLSRQASVAPLAALLRPPFPSSTLQGDKHAR
jgi:2-methylcitrate dehydratase PrpD